MSSTNNLTINQYIKCIGGKNTGKKGFITSISELFIGFKKVPHDPDEIEKLSCVEDVEVRLHRADRRSPDPLLDENIEDYYATDASSSSEEHFPLPPS